MLEMYLNWNADIFGIWFMWAIAGQVSVVVTLLINLLGEPGL